MILSDFVGQHQRRSTTWQNPPGELGLPPDRPEGHRRHGRPGVHPRDHRGLQHPGSLDGPQYRRECTGCRKCRAVGRRQPFDRFAQPRQLQLRPGPQAGHDRHRYRVPDGDRDHGQAQHGRPQHLPGPDHELPRGHAGHGLHLVLRVPHEVLRRPGLQHADRRRVGQGLGQLHAGLRQRGRRERQEGLRHPGRLLPVGGLLPQERLRGQELHGARRPGPISRRCARRCRPTA